MSRQPVSNGDVQQMPLPYAVRNEINQRQNNEDSFQIFAISLGWGRALLPVLAVADGMGGHSHGEDVSREALRKISLTLFEQLSVAPSLNQLQPPAPPDAKTLSVALQTSIVQANDYVQRMVDVNRWGKAGSTVVVAAILENTAVVANLGDSPLFHYRAKDGNLTQVTEEHTLAGALLRAGIISPEMARSHSGRNQLTLYLGSPHLPPDLPPRQVAISPGDLLLLCSDGVSSALEYEQIAAILAGSDLEEMANRLLAASRDAGETDNQTLILWRHPERKTPADTIVVHSYTTVQ
ncbi:PP2C family protein-serine/threonine phosphatase [Kamptonema formosum]|uniref:PP2C family protein-serine/threonine phosphatase n=1 Tax=Kamptonema formosum TaxID=331992 RepID=UPI00037A27BE|nr:protein phosphatase 2C domain-containing protein [Oscillatoria sp. PCC 10802]